MDYKGQELCEYIYYIISFIFGVSSWIYGYMKSDFQLTVYGWFIGLAISVLICIPDWPFYNRHKITWLDEVGKVKLSKDGKSKEKDESNGEKLKKKPLKKDN